MCISAELPVRMRLFATWLMVASAGCSMSAPSAPPSWALSLPRHDLVLLGEVHDNAEQHRLRLALLRRAFAAGWRPAIAMEQFDREHQPDIERARRARPRDAQYLIDEATPSGAANGGWNWAFYRPYVALALEYEVPLLAANLSNADTAKVVRVGYAAVFDVPTLAALRLDRPVAPEWQAAQEEEIDAGHCHQLPRSAWAAMARAQFARDAVMAAVLRDHASRGVVLLAGNGHVRRDFGVPRWLDAPLQARAFTVGYLEAGDSSHEGSFDAVVQTAAAERSDPCADFARRRSGS
jgi:uncharacterized iron-regulated protein